MLATTGSQDIYWELLGYLIRQCERRLNLFQSLSWIASNRNLCGLLGDEFNGWKMIHFLLEQFRPIFRGRLGFYLNVWGLDFINTSLLTEIHDITHVVHSLAAHLWVTCGLKKTCDSRQRKKDIMDEKMEQCWGWSCDSTYCNLVVLLGSCWFRCHKLICILFCTTWNSSDERHYEALWSTY